MLLKLENVKKDYGTFKLDCSIEVKRGQVTGLVGSNGAGKSTTFKSILGLIFPDSGDIEMFGKKLSDITPEDKEKLGVVLTEANTFDYLKAKVLVSILKAMYKSFSETDYIAKCHQYKIPLDKTIKDFSTGMKAKLKLIIALSHDAELLILDEPINIDGYAPHNATKLYYGYTSLRDNVVRSTNIPAVKLLNEVGLNKAKSFAESSGIKFSSADNNLAIALGGFTEGVTISELAGSYVTIARGGSYIKPTFIKSITIDGKVVYENNLKSTNVMSEETAYLITDMLKSVASYGTGRKINDIGNFIASKTGTNATNESNMDAWNASYTTEHTAICWVGNTTGIEGSMHDTMKGSTYPTLFVKNIFSSLYKNSEPKDFEMPSGLTYIEIDKKEYDENHQIFLADETSLEVKKELFKTSSLPSPKPKKEKQKAEIVKLYNNPDSLFKVRIY